MFKYIVIFMYFRNKTTAIENKMDVYNPNKNDKYLEDMKILCGNGELEKNSKIIQNKFYAEIKLSGRRLAT